MKKLMAALLLSAFAIVGAHAADDTYTHDPEHWRVRMDSNPLYRPLEGRFYSLTELNTNTDFEHYGANEEIGFGITDRLSVALSTQGSYDSGDTPPYGTKLNWDNAALGLEYRFVDRGPWIADLYGKVRQDFLTKSGLDTLEYNWTVGTTFGYVGWDRWTVAFTAQADYIKDALGSIDSDAWGMKFGVDGLYNFNRHWNGVAGLYGMFNMNDSEYPSYHDDPLVAKLGFDYNFNDWTYLGVYLTKDIRHDFDEAPMGLGARFGIDF